MENSIQHLIDVRFHSIMNKFISIKRIPASSLISSNRLDISIKIDYVRALIEGGNSDSARKSYENNIEIISNGTFIEPGSSNKKSFKDYDDYLKKLINQMRNGFDDKVSIIPVSKNEIPLDGAHRIAVAAYFNLEVTVAVFDTVDFRYDFNYFRSRFCSQDYLDSLALSHIRNTKKKITLVIEWPRKNQLDSAVNQIFGSSVTYMKEESLNFTAVKNLMLMNYWGEAWVGARGEPKLGINSKAMACYKGGSTKFYWIEGLNVEEVVNRKEHIRRFVQGEKHVIHSTETPNETLMVSQSILTRNSLKMMELIKPEYGIEDILQELEYIECDRGSFAVGGSCLLSLMNLRKNKDVDILTDVETVMKKQETHNEYLALYGYADLSFIYDDQNVFYYFGYKFCMPRIVLDMKRKRNEIKDKSDIILLEGAINQEKKNTFRELKLIWFAILRYVILFTIRLLTLSRLKGPVKSVLTWLRKNDK